MDEGAGVVVMLEFRHEHPIFTVHGHRQQMFGRVFARFEQFCTDAVEVGQEIRDRRLGRHGAVLEGDAIGDHTVAEDDGDLAALVARDHPWRGQLRGVFDVDATATRNGGLRENFLVRDHPFHADVGHGLDHGG